MGDANLINWKSVRCNFVHDSGWILHKSFQNDADIPVMCDVCDQLMRNAGVTFHR